MLNKNLMNNIEELLQVLRLISLADRKIIELQLSMRRSGDDIINNLNSRRIEGIKRHYCDLLQRKNELKNNISLS